MTPDKPLLRGVSHQFAVFVAAGAGLVLVAMARTAHATLAIYALSLVAMFGISATYHRGRWGPRAEAWWRRADHSTIFVFIAGTYTAVAHGPLLAVVWAGAALGVAQAMFWTGAPRALTAAFYVVLGSAVVAQWHSVAASLGAAASALIVVGGALYTAGAVVYALRRPDPAPRVFGYHEVFHALVIAASLCHFAAVVLRVRG